MTKQTNKLIGGGLLALSLVASSAVAKDGVYVGVGLGSAGMGDNEKTYTDRDFANADTKMEYKAGTSTSLLVGYKFSSFRAELENFSHSNDAEKTTNMDGDVEYTNVSAEASASTLLISGYYDLKVNNPKLTPFVGVGFGSTTLKGSFKLDGGSGADVDGDDEVSAFAVTGGLDYAIKDNISIGAAYRLISYGDATLNDKDGDEVTVSTDMSSALIFTAKLKF